MGNDERSVTRHNAGFQPAFRFSQMGGAERVRTFRVAGAVRRGEASHRLHKIPLAVAPLSPSQPPGSGSSTSRSRRSAKGCIEVELVRWLVHPATPSAAGSRSPEVMSDKATMEVPAPFAGTVGGNSWPSRAQGQGRAGRADLRDRTRRRPSRAQARFGCRSCAANSPDV